MPISRRHFFFGSLALPALAAPKAPPERPHILLVLADRLKWENKFEPVSHTPIEGSDTANPEQLAPTKTGDHLLKIVGAGPLNPTMVRQAHHKLM